MIYTLMHKRIPVARLELDDASCAITKISDVYAPEHLPVGVGINGATIDRAALNTWWRRRAIPASRDGIRNALTELNISSPELLLEKCYGLSLSDQYWICPDNSGLSWDEVNFFNHPFSEDVGNILLGHGSSSNHVSLMSPDNSSDGWLKKKWSIIDGKRCLIKGGSGVTQQEPYNEVLASSIMKRLNIPHTEYRIITHNEYPYSVCEDFITEDTDLISAQHLIDSVKKPNHLTTYEHFVNCCKKADVNEAVPFLDRLLTVDFLIANEDRHTNNFGLIRNAETLEYIGFAPIYDNGTSLWYNKPVSMIRPAAPKLPSKPFKETHSEQIKLVSSFDWLDLNALHGIDEEFSEILKDSAFIDDTRRDALCSGLKVRLELLTDIVNTKQT